MMAYVTFMVFTCACIAGSVILGLSDHPYLAVLLMILTASISVKGKP